MIDIGRREADDAMALAEVHRQAFDEPWSATEIAALLRSPGVFAFGAESGGLPVSFILCRLAADEAEILTIATSQAHRRMGAAAKLLDTALATVVALGATTMFLEVAVDNVAARELYEGRHFRSVGRRPGYYARGTATVDALIMRRDLNR